MAKLSNIAVDPDLEVHGVWVSWFDNARVKVARHNNPRFVKRVRELVLERRLQQGKKEMSDDEFEDLTRRAVADTIAIDWENIEDEETGQPVAYTSDLGYKLFCQPEYRDFYRLVIEASMRFELFRKERIIEAVGN
ncbi:putative structural protein [Caudoviricetes sp.]|nr:putative structural protein [Caudoviricetes sp.]UOF82724.1 putative structural protein [Caudoviricetes sp.]